MSPAPLPHCCRPLSAAQQAYAATDAFAVVALFEELLGRQQPQHAQQAAQQHRTLQPLTHSWLALMAGERDLLIGSHCRVAVAR